MPPIITTANLVCKDGQARDKVLSHFHAIAKYTYEYEPLVHRYIISIPIDVTNTTDIWMVEMYASPEVQAAHIATPPVDALIDLFTNTDVLVSAPDVHDLPLAFHKPCPGVSHMSNPAVVLAWFEYVEGKIDHALDGWREVVDYVTDNEEWTRGYAVMGDTEENKLRTVEVYDSWECVEDVHMKSPAIKKNHVHNGRDRLRQGAVKVKVVGGFLGRD
ncbi:hypothetical protein P154DRAFT_483076 [Amniculicola lignicola CBS 123094]|uniref:ABM domain-containing protein n=1 Tax=Amniculicola lignicola CBS 123094 TaxID=1392246 RepID=A0A6A5X2K2_9PLEO|nr:hypothetical protein P154DRAFT_483076 [Amniculicola lignicola CBS 123094]